MVFQGQNGSAKLFATTWPIGLECCVKYLARERIANITLFNCIKSALKQPWHRNFSCVFHGKNRPREKQHR